MKRRLAMVLAAVICVVMLGGAALAEDAIYQVSTLNALMLGLYDGVTPVEEYLRNGDTGLGTLDRLDGEMITLDGVVYQVKDDGTVVIAEDTQTIPFGVVTDFAPESVETLAGPLVGMDALTAYVDALPEIAENKNRMYVIKLTGHFDAVRTRSVPAQDKPYQPLHEVTQTQSEFSFEALDGTVVGVYFPDYLASVNMHGWHFHFLSEDKTKGGHLLDAEVASGIVEVDTIDQLMLALPDTADFASAHLCTDLAEAIESAEK